MSMVSFGDLTQAFLLKSQTARLKGEVGRVTQELSSGRLSDVGSALSGDYSRLSALSRARQISEGYQSTARETLAQAGASQSAIATLSKAAEALVSPLFAASQQESASQITRVAQDARARLDDALGTLNASYAGRALFAGTSVQGPALAGASVILDALRTELVGATTPAEAMSRISNWFDSATGFGAVAYQGGPTLSDVAVSATDRAWVGPTADDPAIRTALKGFAAAALLNDSSLTLPMASRHSFALVAGEAMMGGQAALTDLAARLGQSESRIDAALSRTAADLLTYELAQSELVQSDPYRLATELEAVKTNLETVYAVTARLSRLSLVDFLR